MKRHHVYLLGFITAFILWMALYANAFYLAGKHGWDIFLDSGGIFLSVYYLIALIISFFAAKDIYEERRISIRLSIIYGLPVFIFGIAFSMSNEIASGGLFFIPAYTLLFILYVLSIFLKPSK